jgi:hypothetical protein
MPRQHARLTNFASARSAVTIQDPDLAALLRQIQDTLDTINGQIAVLIGPGQRPTGPVNPRAIRRHGSIVIRFLPDLAAVSARAYRVWRAPAGTVSSPVTPTASEAIQVGTVAPLWDVQPAGTYSFVDTDFTDTDLDPSDYALFEYWVSTLDNRGRESARIPASV